MSHIQITSSLKIIEDSIYKSDQVENAQELIKKCLKPRLRKILNFL